MAGSKKKGSRKRKVKKKSKKKMTVAQRKKDALKKAKDAWKDAPQESNTNNHTITGIKGGTIYVQQDDLPEHPVLHLTGLEDCIIKVNQATMVKVLMDRCPGCELHLVDTTIHTGTVEIWSCTRKVELHSNNAIGTLQLDVCAEVRLHLDHKVEELGQIVQAGIDMLSVSFLSQPEHDFRSGISHLQHEYPEVVGDMVMQFISRFVDNEILTEKILRLANEFPTTAREQNAHHAKRGEVLQTARAVAATHEGLTEEDRANLQQSVEQLANQADAAAEIDPQLSKASRIESKRLKGNEAFKAGNVPQAAVFYTEALLIDEANPSPAILANRALCFLRMDQPEEALQDATTCIQLDPTYLKAHFRRGVALSILDRHIEAGQAFTKVLESEPNHKKAKDGFHMSQMRAARQRGEMRRD